MKISFQIIWSIFVVFLIYYGLFSLITKYNLDYYLGSFITNIIRKYPYFDLLFPLTSTGGILLGNYFKF
jgi:hypothetical protein